MGGLEDIEAVAGAGVVKAAPGIAALHIDTEGLAEVIDAPLMRMTGSASRILTDEDGVVVLPAIEFFTAFIQQT